MKNLIKSNTYKVFSPMLLCFALFVSACSSVKIDNDSPADKHFAEGERLLKKDQYLEAIERFQILKTRYPYSVYTPLANLRIADAYFAQESYIEAASSYKIFRELYPKHEKSDYAIFRTAESHFNDVPDAIDRALGSAQSAIDSYEDLINRFPSSPYAKTGQE